MSYFQCRWRTPSSGPGRSPHCSTRSRRSRCQRREDQVWQPWKQSKQVKLNHLATMELIGNLGIVAERKPRILMIMRSWVWFLRVVELFFFFFFFILSFSYQLSFQNFSSFSRGSIYWCLKEAHFYLCWESWFGCLAVLPGVKKRSKYDWELGFKHYHTWHLLDSAREKRTIGERDICHVF